MKPTEPLELHHSWPIIATTGRFDGGMIHDAVVPGIGPANDRLADRGIGRWSCELADARITWSPAVYDLFGLPRTIAVDRATSLGFYAEASRAAMERLRTYAIRHRRGFTIDVELRTASIGTRWMRLLGAPVCVDGRVVRLEGLKQDIGCRYR